MCQACFGNPVPLSSLRLVPCAECAGMCRNGGFAGPQRSSKRPFRSHPPSVLLLLLRRMSEILEGKKKIQRSYDQVPNR